MSYDIIAKSTDDARPVELYQISYSGNNWFYTSGDRPIVYGGVTYTPVVVKRGDIEQATDVLNNAADVSFDRTTPFLDVFRIQPPSEVVTLAILATNYLVDNEFIIVWKGRIINVSWDSEGWGQCTTESVYSSLQQMGLRRRFSRTCVHVLYGHGCKVSREDYRENGTVTQINGVNVFLQEAVGKEYNHYAGGYITWENNQRGNVEKRMIRESFDNGQLVLTGQTINLSAGATVDVYPGCDHLIATCEDKFHNEDNYGGTPYIPGVNPFSGTTLY